MIGMRMGLNAVRLDEALMSQRRRPGRRPVRPAPDLKPRQSIGVVIKQAMLPDTELSPFFDQAFTIDARRRASPGNDEQNRTNESDAPVGAATILLVWSGSPRVAGSGRRNEGMGMGMGTRRAAAPGGSATRATTPTRVPPEPTGTECAGRRSESATGCDGRPC